MAQARAVIVFFICTSAGLAAAWENTAIAQTALEEVVVTAQKREQSAQDLGISLTALTADDLRDRGVKDMASLMAQVPGAQYSSNPGVVSAFAIRGVSQQSFDDHQEQPIALYSDGAYVSFLGALGQAMFDLERVEVLRGPQSTLFGRNATGGVVSIISTRPTADFSSYGDLTVGNLGAVRFEGALNGPLSDTLSARLSVLREKQDGYVDNTAGPSGLGTDLNSVRLQMLWKPSDSVNFLLNGRYSHSDSEQTLYYLKRDITDSFANGPIPGGVNDGYAKPPPSQAAYAAFCQNFLLVTPPTGNTDCYGNQFSTDPWKTTRDGSLPQGHIYSQIWGSTGTLTWDLNDALEITSVSDYQKFQKSFREETYGVNADLYNDGTEAAAYQLSQETRMQGSVGPLRYLGGFYYLDIMGHYAPDLLWGNVLGANYRNSYTLRTHSWAPFVQLEQQLSANWGLIEGFRWTWDRKHLNLDARCVDLIAGACDFLGNDVQNNQKVIQDHKENEWSGNLELDRHLDRDKLLYAKVSRGYKAGGFNSSYSDFYPVENIAFKGEVLNSAEIGGKFTFPEQNLRINASAFYYDYQNFQSFFTVGAASALFNVDAVSRGLDLDITAEPLPHLTLQTGLSYMDAHEKNVVFNGSTSNMPMPYTPKVSANWLARYGWKVAEGDLSLQADGTYVTSRELSGINNPIERSPPYALVNLRAMYVPRAGRWSVELWTKNVTNRYYPIFAYDNSVVQGVAIFIPDPPRTYGASIHYSTK